MVLFFQSVKPHHCVDIVMPRQNIPAVLPNSLQFELLVPQAIEANKSGLLTSDTPQIQPRTGGKQEFASDILTATLHGNH